MLRDTDSPMDVAFASRPGSAAKPNEDYAVACPTVAVVLDGLSAPAELGTGCVHGTPWYATQLGMQLLARAATDPRTSLQEILAGAIETVTDAHRVSCDVGHPGTPSASVVLLREAPEAIEYLVLFDSTLALDTIDGPVITSDDRVLRFARAERAATREHRLGAAEHATAVSALVAAERVHRNQPGGYWVAGARPEAAAEAATGSVERAKVRRAALMTDGVSCLVDDYARATWASLFDRLHQTSPEALIASIREVEASDPEGVKWPRYKVSDDATVASCRFRFR